MAWGLCERRSGQLMSGRYRHKVYNLHVFSSLASLNINLNIIILPSRRRERELLALEWTNLYKIMSEYPS